MTYSTSDKMYTLKGKKKKQFLRSLTNIYIIRDVMLWLKLNISIILSIASVAPHIARQQTKIEDSADNLIDKANT